jgi:hypothetical protein
MSDLSTLADHARKMSTARHKPECPPRHRRPQWVNDHDSDGLFTGGHEDPPPCPGCVTDADRALWTRIADEIDDYLTPAEEGMLL